MLINYSFIQNTVLFIKETNNMNAFDKVYLKIISEAIGNTSYYNARRQNGEFVMGKNYMGEEVSWMIGPTDQKKTIDYITGEKLPWMTTVLWLPNARGPNRGISIAYETYKNIVDSDIPESIAILEKLGLPLDIDFENVGN